MARSLAKSNISSYYAYEELYVPHVTFNNRRERFAPMRRAVGWAFSIGALLVTVGLTIASLGQPMGMERNLTALVLCLLIVWALMERALAGRRLTQSERDLHGEAWRAADPAGDVLGPSATWWARVQRAAHDLAAGVGERPPAEVPDPTVIVDPVRAQAEKSALMLRWLSGAAVLVGLVGTLFGLSHAIGGAIEAFAKASSNGNLEFGRALDPLRFCFLSSLEGVTASFGLGLLRLTYEADLDVHFAEVGWALRLHQERVLYANWRPPGQLVLEAVHQLHLEVVALKQDPASGLAGLKAGLDRQYEAACQLGGKLDTWSATLLDGNSKLGSLAEQMVNVSTNWNTTATRVLDETAKVVTEKLVPVGPQLVNAVTEGLKSASNAMLSDFATKAEEQTKDLSNKYQALTSLMTNAQSDFNLKALKLSHDLGEVAKTFSQVGGETVAALGDVGRSAGKAVEGATTRIEHAFDASLQKAIAASGERDERLASQADALAKQVEGTVAAIRTSLEAVQSAERDILKQMSTTHASLQAASASLSGAVDASTQRMERAVIAAGEEASRGWTDAGEQVKAMIDSTQSAVHRSIREVTVSLQGAGSETAVAARQLMAPIEQFAQDRRAMELSVRELGEKLSATGMGVTNALTAIASAAESVERIVSVIIRTKEDMKGFADGISNHTKQLAALSVTVATDNDNLRSMIRRATEQQTEP